MRLSNSPLRSITVALLTLLATSAAVCAQNAAATGVIVEQVTTDGAAAGAGIRVGDVLQGWSRSTAPPANPTPAQGSIDSPFDVYQLEIDQAPRGDVTFTGTRNGIPISFLMPQGPWQLRARPRMPVESQRMYEEGVQLIRNKETDKGLTLWRDAAKAGDTTNDVLSYWTSWRVARVLSDNKRWKDAGEAFDRAIQEAGTAGDRTALTAIWEDSAKTFEQQNDLVKAERAYREALKIREEDDPAGLRVAWSLHDLGNLAKARYDLEAAKGLYEKATDIRTKLAPGSLVLARTLNNLGITARDNGDFVGADNIYRQAMEIQEKLLPASLDVARTFINWGLVAKNLGDYVNAEDRDRKALAIVEKLAPGSPFLAVVLNNLGSVAMERDDPDTAEDFFRKALAIAEKVSPGTLDVANRLSNLGNVELKRRDLAAAEDLYKRALEIGEKVAPDTPGIATFLINYGILKKERGDLVAAEAFEKRALDIGEKHDEPYGMAIQVLGDLARDRNDLASAESFYQRVLEIAKIDAPESTYLAAAFHRLADISRRKGDLALATDYFERTVEQLELQQAKVGGADDVRSGFAASYARYYGDLAEQYVATGRTDDAFHVLERSRARGLLQMLAERNLILTDLPADLEKERKATAREYDQTQDKMADLDPAKEAEQVKTLENRLRELRDKREGILERIRQASPRLAALQYPQPLTIEGVQRNLDPGTVLLSYMVAEEKVFLFVTGGAAEGEPSLSMFTLNIKPEELRKKIETFRTGVQHPEENSAAWVRTGRELYDLLVKAADDWIAKSERVLISPDGPLHALPFGALVVQSAADGSSPKYLIQAKPLHVVTSATLYAELKKDRREAPMSLVAFGDPAYPALSLKQDEATADPQTRSLLRRGYSFEPLPSSRSEVETIAKLFPDHATVYVGKEATEEHAKTTGKDVRYLHFAAHGILDERFPLNSALVLSMPDKSTEGRDNGLLQAWEIFERVRINADLVVLSACESALGKEVGGEGLLGLTRAFQYAGARSIVASLWSVADESTSELMKRFYGYLKSGTTKDDALRAAQIDLIQGSGLPSDMAHPFHWAAFELIGDWK